MSLQANYPSIRPSLLLDFANAQALDPRVTFTRASTATYFDGEGVLRTAAAGAARFAFDPVTEESLGLLIEEARTNLAFPSNMPTSTVQTITGTMQANGETQVTANVPAPDGTSNGFTISGASSNTNTSGSNNFRALAVMAAVGTYTVSMWIKTQLTDTTVSLREASSGAVFNFQTSAAWTRISATVTTTSINQNIIIYSTSGTSFDCFGFQVEAGAFPTSYIPTVASQVTRAGDLAVMTGANFTSWFNPNESTFYAEAATNAVPSNTYHYICSLSLGTSTTAGDFARMAFLGTLKTDLTLGNTGTFVTLNTAGFPATTVGVSQKSAIAIAVQDLAGTAAAGTMSTSTARTRLEKVDTFTIGNQAALSSNRAMNGAIKKIAYYPARLSNATLQALTR